MENRKKNSHDDDDSMNPPDDQRCRRNSGKGWRCKNMVSNSHYPSEYCDKHYNSHWWNPNQAANKNQSSKKLHSSDNVIQVKRRRVETTEKSTYQVKRCSSNEARSLGEEDIQKFEVQLEGILGLCKTECLELLWELEEKTMIKCIGMQGKIADQFEFMKIAFVDELKKLKKSGFKSTSKNRLEFSEKLHGKVGNTAADSDGENVGQSPLEDSDSKISLGDCMDKLALKWKIEGDTISSFEKDPELCMKAVCALYRQQSFEENYANGIKNLAEFLMEGDRKGDLKKCMKEFVEVFTYKELEHCNRLARSYSKQLFSIYKDKQDPFFLPTSTASF